jgi:hypothetical protein
VTDWFGASDAVAHSAPVYVTPCTFTDPLRLTGLVEVTDSPESASTVRRFVAVAGPALVTVTS